MYFVILAYTPYLWGKPHFSPQFTTPYSAHRLGDSDEIGQTNGPPLSFWQASGPPSLHPAQSMFRVIVLVDRP